MFIMHREKGAMSGEIGSISRQKGANNNLFLKWSGTPVSTEKIYFC